MLKMMALAPQRSQPSTPLVSLVPVHNVKSRLRYSADAKDIILGIRGNCPPDILIDRIISNLN